MTDAPRTARERARAQITLEITQTARRHLATDGAAGLSLRAVARDLGMASSAVYRYVPSRDDLLTRLILEAYNSLGAAAESADAAVRRGDILGRWLAIVHAVRVWALAHPHEYALIYGSPVPGYAAPEDTIGPASRVSTLLITLLAAVHAAGTAPTPTVVPRTAHRSLSPLRVSVPGYIADDLIIRGLMAWTQLFGAVNFELFGQFHNVIDSNADYFDHVMRRVATEMGLSR